jgi:hypothetical protein
MKKSDYEEKSNQRAFALFCVLFLLLLAATCRSQSRDYPTPMKFSCGLKDTIYISIAEDEFSGNYLTVSCTKHNHTEWKSITLGFVDGDILEFFPDNGWWVADVDKLSSVEFDYISFDEQYFSTACMEIKTKDYFIKYFNK